jgi:hypothetical protein
MKKQNIAPEVGDLVEVRLDTGMEVGTLLESFDVGIILLKLQNGYNIGIRKEKILEMKIRSLQETCHVHNL